VKFQLNEQSELFDRLYCVDFIKNDGAVEMVEFQPENILTFEPITGTFGDASLAIKHLRWDDVLIRHDLDELPAHQLSNWFQLWFDPKDARHGALDRVLIPSPQPISPYSMALIRNSRSAVASRRFRPTQGMTNAPSWRSSSLRSLSV